MMVGADQSRKPKRAWLQMVMVARSAFGIVVIAST